MIVMTWNIQWCRGCDGMVDPGRIARVARELADFDVLCLQEVARNFTGLEGSSGEDQFALLSAALPGYTLVEGIATDRLAADGVTGRMQFGNAIFTRLPVLQVFRHLLPWPPDPKPKSPGMQRTALELVLQTAGGPLRVTTTHLEYYSKVQRMAQVGRLRGLQAEAAAHAADISREGRDGGPFAPAPRPASGILAADFNFRPDCPEYALLQMPIEGAPRYRDAWTVRHGETPHAPTVGVHDGKQWQCEPFCFDLMLVTEDLAPRVEEITVDAATDASDHQPVILRLKD